MEEDEISKKQNFLSEEIIEKNYDKTAFIDYCLSKKENGDDLNNWTLEELKTIVNDFQSQYKYNKYIYILKIIIQSTGFLDKRNLYLNFYFRKNAEKIKYKKSCPYEIQWFIEEKDISTLHKTTINVCIYESGMLKDKFIGDFNIKLFELKNKRVFSQKCEMNLGRKRKGEYSIAEIKLEQSKSIHLKEKPINEPSQILSTYIICEKPLSANNNKGENKIIEKLNEEIFNLKNILNEKEKIINEEKNEIKKLNEKLLEMQNLLNEKEIIIEEKNSLSKKLNEKIMDLQNLLRVKEEEFIEEKKKLEESNQIIKKNKFINDYGPKEEKMIKLLDDIESKEKEIKKLNEMKSRFPFELLENEKLMTLIIISNDQKIHYSLVCKNTQKFTIIEYKLYEKYPEYLEFENFFLINGNKINKYKSLEENNIKNSDIITLFKYDEM